MYVQERVSLDENKTISVGLVLRPVPTLLNLGPTAFHNNSTESGPLGCGLFAAACPNSYEEATSQRGLARVTERIAEALIISWVILWGWPSSLMTVYDMAL